ncbi:hypothetical protein ACIQM4_06765 [Streptomyces sp. NPDC091272]|uniref:hypothetical protein n=1 Tax=Streptomyces sp. NPDC091272 TaxID=3365981 RepID=UPI0038275DB0
MYEHRATDPAPMPRPPPGMVASLRQPGEVRVGDYIRLDGTYLQVQDMRALGIAGHRVLIFSDHQPWVMRKATTTYRMPDYR